MGQLIMVTLQAGDIRNLSGGRGRDREPGSGEMAVVAESVCRLLHCLLRHVERREKFRKGIVIHHLMVD